MKKLINEIKLNNDECAKFMEAFKDQFQSECDIELWLGLKGGTTLKVLILNDDGSVLIDYGVTVEQLKADMIFFSACLQDGDVFHNLDYDDKLKMSTITPEDAQMVIDWYQGRTDFLPCTPCGFYNYVSDYLEADN